MIRFGIMGPGSIAHKFAEDIKLVKNAKLVAVASNNFERANKFKNDFKIEYSFDSYEELAKSDVVDAIYVATPHVFHKANALLAINNKKHVLIEKPITVNESELNQLIDAAKKNKVLIMEAMWSRFLPAVIKVKKLIEDNVIGDIISFKSDFSFTMNTNYPKDGRLINPYLAGGTILDLGVYNISIARYFIKDKISKISSHSILTEDNVDLQNESKITTESGIIIETSSSIIRTQPHTAIITGTKGNIIMEDFSRPDVFYLNNERYEYPYTRGGFNYQIESFCRNILNGELENKIMPLNDSIDVIKILDQIRKVSGVKYPFEK